MVYIFARLAQIFHISRLLLNEKLFLEPCSRQILYQHPAMRMSAALKEFLKDQIQVNLNKYQDPNNPPYHLQLHTQIREFILDGNLHPDAGGLGDRANYKQLKQFIMTQINKRDEIGNCRLRRPGTGNYLN